MHIENFKCFKDFDIELGPFNVLIGPNDSGKTALLQAIRLAGCVGTKLCEAWPAHPLEEQIGVRLCDGVAVWRGRTDSIVTMRIKTKAPQGDDWDKWGDAVYQVVSGSGTGGRAGERFEGRVWRGDEPFPARQGQTWVTQRIGSPDCYRLDPSDMKEPSLIVDRMTDTGKDLPGYLAGIKLRDDEVFGLIERRFCTRFGSYSGLSVAPPKGQPAGAPIPLKFNTRWGSPLDARDVSDGVLLSLAFISLAYHPEPPEILLIEEPENGVHHAALKDIIGTLKGLSQDKDVQVILTTHSPHLLDEVEPSEVHVFTKDQEGAVHAKRLSDHPEVESLKKHFTTGEIWTGLEEEDDFVDKLGGKK